jgi:hypothetical protein
MEDIVPLGGRVWWSLLAVLGFSRGADLFSTWVATPSLLLEANPIARWLGWRWAIPLNVAISVGFAFFPLPAIILGTTSALVASRNFQQAWLMRSYGEENYRDWQVQRIQETPLRLFLGCLGLQNLLVGGIGLALAWSSMVGNEILIIPFGIGVGIVAYAVTVTFYSLLAVRGIRRAMV